jgi:1-acyl-sn-glycerol-3-phosphate acyltransferase
MNLLRSTLFALVFFPGSVVFVLLAILGALFGTTPLTWATHGWARWHRICAWLLLGVRTRIEGTIPSGAVLVASKHQSMFETVEFLLILDKPAVVLKRELADLPGWGWVARRFGVIPVDRAGGAVALRRMLNAAKSAVAAGRPIMIFPEGHAGAARRAARSPARLCRPLQVAWRAGGADRARQRSALAAAVLCEAPRPRDDARRRDHPAGPAAQGGRGARPRRHQSAGRGAVTPELG